jgi:hypothetical protein
MSDFSLTTVADALNGVVAGTSAASKAVVLGADGKINAIDVTALKIGGTAVDATADEIDTLDGLARGSIIVGGVAGTTVLDAKTSGQILVGDGNDIKSVVVGGDATLGSDGNLALAVPKLSYINKICAIADFTDDSSDENGYIDFTSQLPAGAIPLGWKAVVTEGFAGDTSAIIKVGTAGVPDGLSGNVTQSVLVPGIVGSNASCGSSSSYMGIAFTPRVTVTSGSDFSNVTAGAMTVYIYYIVTT